MSSPFSSLLNAVNDAFVTKDSNQLSFSIPSLEFSYPQHYTPIVNRNVYTRVPHPVIFIPAYQHFDPSTHYSMITPTDEITPFGIGDIVWVNGRLLGLIMDIDSVQKQYMTYLLWDGDYTY